ncbi:sugar-binding domain-containing protein [Tautonia sociabilis]|nr:sugar-binding domain-containing protein [Tautonia sociabilis]
MTPSPTRALLAATVAALAAASASAASQDESIPRPEHPEPQAVRSDWANLNGSWEFRFDPDDAGLDSRWFEPEAEGFDREIIVPFAWESRLSGIGEVDSPEIGWYRRTFRVPDDWPEGRRVWLRFGAVDYRADVWVNGTKVAEHEGGYTPFEADVTDALADGDGENVLVVRAFDPTARNLPTGKQIDWYTTVSGIWQTVWLEARPESYIAGFFIRTESLDPARVAIDVTVGGPRPEGEWTVSLKPDDPTVEAASARVAAPSRSSEGELASARIEAVVSQAKPWSPESPHLYDLAIELKDPAGNVIDSVRTYFGLRTIARGTFGDEPFERFLLNGKPVYIRGALDQSYNPDGLYTAPSDEFLRRDVASARVHGLNCLRIHIKTEEPRKLYWADKYGLLIMQDLPNTWEQDQTARDSWERTMREAVPRDRNHPSIWSWVAFNETWGLAPFPWQSYKQATETHQWVKAMVAAIRALDPTRLVEDNSPDKRDHVEGTDINSWHFYIDDDDRARAHIEEVVSQTKPGSPFNYVPGQVQGTEPLMNSEYGNVSAGGGDRDISWGFRYLTTQLRKHNTIQGYIYTELTDIEWEHNGFLNYDRTPKVFGYDAFLPDMWVNELNQADFVGFDAPPAIVGRPGETVEVPVFISHYSDLDFEPALRWWVQGADDRGNERMVVAPESFPARWEPYGVTWQEPIRVTLPDYPFVGALILTLRDPQNRRFAANYVNLVVRSEDGAPRVSRKAALEREVTLRFDPEDYARSQWSDPANAPEGKVYGRGHGYFEYRIAVPQAVAQAKPESFNLLVEASAKAGRERVDWPDRVNAQDYPQTDARPFPSTLVVSINGEPLPAEPLEDDPADSRGVLSHLAGVEHGSHGALLEFGGELPEAARLAIAAGEPLVLRFEVPEDAEHVGGLAIFGDSTGRYPIDPTLELVTAEPLPEDLGVDPSVPVAVDSAASRRQAVLPTGESGAGASWSYTTSDPGEGWASPDFDASSWASGRSGFGTEGTPGIAVHTRWDTPTIWLRTEVDLPGLSPDDQLTLRLFHDEGAQVIVNGRPIVSVDGYVTSYRDLLLSPEQRSAFRAGRNVIAVRCRQTGGGQGIDLGLSLLRSE